MTTDVVMARIATDGTTIAIKNGKLSYIKHTTWDEVAGKPTWIGDKKPTYTLDEILNNGGGTDGVVTLLGDQSIEGIKTFLNGLKIGRKDTLISYDERHNAIILPVNLIVEGGIAWNSRIKDFTKEEIFSITDAVSVDGTSIIKVGGVLTVSPEYIKSVGGLNEGELKNYLTDHRYITEESLDNGDKYATQKWVKDNIAATDAVTIQGDQNIIGIKNFVNGAIFGGDGGALLRYDVEKKCWVFPNNVLVEGGIAWNAKIEGFDAPTITDAVSIDGTSIIRDGGVLRVNPDYIQSVGGLDENELANYLTNNNYAKKSDIPSLSGYATESFVVSQGYITQPTLADSLTPYAKTADVNSLLTEYLPRSESKYYPFNGVSPRYIPSDADLNDLTSSSSGFWNSLDHTVYQNAPTQNFGLLSIRINTNYFSQLVLPYNNGSLKYRSQVMSNGRINWREWKTILDSNNIGDYALPITGGTVNGSVEANGYIRTEDSFSTKNNIFITAGRDYNSVYSRGIYFVGTNEVQSGAILGYGDGNGLNYINIIANDGNYKSARGLVVCNNSYVGIGTTTPSTQLEVNGNVKATGNISSQSVIINGKTISYNADKNAFVLPANLLVEGGIAWNAKIEGFDAPTITDAVSIDGTSIIRDGGVLRVNPDYIQSVGGLDENELANYLTNNNYAKKSDIPSLSGYATESFVVSQGYITQPTLADSLTPYAKTADVNSLLTEYLPRSESKYYPFNGVSPRYIPSDADLNDLTSSSSGFWNSLDHTVYQNAPTQNFGLLSIRINTNYFSQLVLPYNNGSLKYRSQVMSNGRINWREWKTILDSNNIGDYALPITGGTVNGSVEANGYIRTEDSFSTKNNIFITAGRDYNSVYSRGIYFVGTNEVQSGAILGYGDGNGLNYINIIANDGNYKSARGLVVCNNSYVGIGTTTPSTQLEVNGNVKATGNISSQSVIINGKTISYNADKNAFVLPANLLVEGGIAWNSSRALKTGIKEHYLTLDALEQIKPYRYKWMDRRDDLIHAGAIADEVMEVLPEVVITDAKNIHSMDYAQTAFVMAASLTPHVSDHERRIKELETENVALKREIEKLKRAS